jgi:purine-binding chemotaxis protein CheW
MEKAMTDQKGEDKYLTFAVGREEYGVEILRVREIVGLLDITAVPMTTTHIRGVINLRGKIIPVLDLRHKLGLPPTESVKENCIVIVTVAGRQGESPVGLLVDSVNEVFKEADAQKEPLPEVGEGKSLDFVKGLAKVRGRLVILLDVEKTVLREELEGLEELENLAKAGR